MDAYYMKNASSLAVYNQPYLENMLSSFTYLHDDGQVIRINDGTWIKTLKSMKHILVSSTHKNKLYLRPGRVKL